ncbi:hypothetical protein [Sinomonas terrae]|uniref:Integrase n=1 Tax=Sinomonas terrae TaxID=2908838 RepID=A0ABS9U6V5_9MICC|nr:hypothetical protein [Sinomonas terrae]MCH6472434.1 hypothetical protein [Sinomonas terrae]
MAQRAALPEPGYGPPETVRFEDGAPVVRFFPEHGSEFSDFRFVRLGLPELITIDLALGFARATGPGGTRRTAQSAQALFSSLKVFANALMTGPSVPESLGELAPSALHRARLASTSGRAYVSVVHSLRLVLRGSQGLPSGFRDALYAPNPAVIAAGKVEAYGDGEVAAVRRAARKVVRKAALRIRAARSEAEEFLARHGTPELNRVPDANEKRALLAHIFEHGDLPRLEDGNLAVPRSGALLAELNPTREDAHALVALLICLTGLNLSTVLGLTADHLAASAAAETPAVLLRGVKARRGPQHSEMDLAFIGKSSGSGADDLSTAHGVYQLALELGEDLRRHTGDDGLFMFYAKASGGRAATMRYRRMSAQACRILLPGFEDQSGERRRVDTGRIRRWYLDRHQRPVAQSAQTLASVYLARDASTLDSYQGVVEEALEGEVDRIRIENARRVLTEADRTEALHDPEAVARRFGLTTETLRGLLAGDLDTVAGACMDNTNSPHSPTGTPCKASFLLCLGCPCSRSEPRHIPVQALTLIGLRELRPGLDEHEWERKYAPAAAQLEDLMDLQKAVAEDQAAQATEEDARLVRALLDGDLDLR